MKLTKFSIIALLLLTTLTAPGYALAESLKIHLAGFAFKGNFDKVKANYPLTLKISNETIADGRGLLDVELVKRLSGIRLKNGQISVGELAKIGDGSLTMACCLDTELVTVEQYDDGYKLVVDLGAQALLFDYGQMKVVASYPVMVELIDYTNVRPDEQLISDRIRGMLLSNKYGVNLFDDIIEILEKAEIKRSYGSAIRVKNVFIEEKAHEHLPARFKDDPDNLKAFVAQNFGKYISLNQRVSILPYTKGSDIGNKMAVRFSDARIFDLQIPEAQFAVDLTVRGFKKVCTEEKTSGSCWVYGAYTRIKIYQPVLDKVYMEENLMHAVSKIVSSSQGKVEDWPVYQNSLVALFNEVTQSFSKDSKYKEVRKVIEKCT